MTPCPCGSNNNYNLCCGCYINGEKRPKTPEALMRSRYTAYTLINIAYIEATMRGKALEHFDPVEAKQWAENVKWLNLTILSAPTVNEQDKTGTVEFVAKYRLNDQIQALHENSQFERIDGQWFYTDGDLEQKYINKISNKKTARNDPCPCKSGKKYKKCCLKK